MKIALITTTIRVPHVLALYREHAGPEVRFFVAGDRKSPHAQTVAMLGGLQNAAYFYDDQAHSYAPLDSTCRRNIALLEALRWGADVIVTIDDDNIPIDSDYFINFEALFGRWDRVARPPFNGLQATGPWFDPGSLTLPPVHHRGFPHAHYAWSCSAPHAHRDVPSVLRPVTGAKVGVAAGLWLGDPDVSAITRIATAPYVHGIAEIARAGVVVDPRSTWTVWNSQNTSFIRELAPAMMMIPGIGRYEDIWASMVCQRVMREKGYVAHFGLPLVHQQRNLHDLHNDLELELFGEKHTLAFAEFLDGVILPSTDSVLDSVLHIYAAMDKLDWMPLEARNAGLAWCHDLSALGGML
jgi:hypothetical protein